MVGRRDTGHRGQGDVRHGSLSRICRKALMSTCMGSQTQRKQSPPDDVTFPSHGVPSAVPSTCVGLVTLGSNFTCRQQSVGPCQTTPPHGRLRYKRSEPEPLQVIVLLATTRPPMRRLMWTGMLYISRHRLRRLRRVLAPSPKLATCRSTLVKTHPSCAALTIQWRWSALVSTWSHGAEA